MLVLLLTVDLFRSADWNLKFTFSGVDGSRYRLSLVTLAEAILAMEIAWALLLTGASDVGRPALLTIAALLTLHFQAPAYMIVTSLSLSPLPLYGTVGLLVAAPCRRLLLDAPLAALAGPPRRRVHRLAHPGRRAPRCADRCRHLRRRGPRPAILASPPYWRAPAPVRDLSTRDGGGCFHDVPRARAGEHWSGRRAGDGGSCAQPVGSHRLRQIALLMTPLPPLLFVVLAFYLHVARSLG